MSTAALASARRRRTTNEPPSSSQNVSNRLIQQESSNSSKQALPPPQSLTPLQILQLHDNKLKDLEALLVELNSEEYITNIVEGKINNLMRAKLATFSNELDKVKPSTSNSNTNTNTNTNINSFETKLQLIETTIQTNLTIQNVRLDEFKNGMQENFNTFKENTIKMIDLLNVKESVPSINHSDSNVEKLDMLTKEVNELKLLVIKNQSLALETCTSIINMKDEFKLNNEKIEEIIENITNLSNRQCNEPQCDPAQMFLQSFMKNNLFGGVGKVNMDADYDDNDELNEDIMNTDNNKKLHIDLTNEQLDLDDEEIISGDDKVVLNASELIIDENQLQEILDLNSMEDINLNNDSLKQEVINEIRNISLINTENNLEDKIETDM